MPARHYGLDWLRIAAFALLIVYHVGLMLSPWDWHVNAEHPVDGIVYLLVAMNPWRMLLLFLVSGYAARAVLARAPTIADFARSRAARLLIPLAFGACVIVVPQPWVEIQQKLSYAHGLLYFWRHDYFGWGTKDYHAFGFFHLWFVAYIWVYSMLVAAAAALLPASAKARCQRLFERAMSGWRLLILPVAWLLLVRLVLMPGAMPTNRVLDDLAGHAIYLPAFLFGFALARAPSLWPDIARSWRPALGLVVVGYALLAWRLAGHPGAAWLLPDHRVELGPASLMGWGAILLLLGAANRWWNHDHRWRGPLTQAVFPVYLIHQTLIVLIGWWLVRHHWGAAAEFIILIVGTAIGCWLFYEGGRRIGPLRPLIGLPRRLDGRERVVRPQPPIRSLL
ncbi:acyltransferase [Sphingomonas sp. DBB INV C78]|uniref:acyltransferase family protein n=1 Tax=Sphingomonas sp. DBB INV C78 TaxID=3349434 RepID=UPI0036D2ABDC